MQPAGWPVAAHCWPPLGATVTLALVVFSGPLLITTMLCVQVWPLTMVVDGLLVSVTPKSVPGVMVVLRDSELLVETRSSSLLTVAVGLMATPPPVQLAARPAPVTLRLNSTAWLLKP